MGLGESGTVLGVWITTDFPVERFFRDAKITQI